MHYLWTILSGISFFSCIFIAVRAARDAKPSFGGYALSVAIGLALGGVFAWTTWSIGKRGYTALETRSEARQKLYVDVLYFATLFWIFIAAYITSLVTSAVMRLVT